MSSNPCKALSVEPDPWPAALLCAGCVAVLVGLWWAHVPAPAAVAGSVLALGCAAGALRGCANQTTTVIVYQHNRACARVWRDGVRWRGATARLEKVNPVLAVVRVAAPAGRDRRLVVYRSGVGAAALRGLHLWSLSLGNDP